jgi:hypothetical protein
MFSARSSLRVIAVVAVTALAGCASGGSGGTTGDDQNVTAKKPPAKGPVRFHQLKSGPTSKNLLPLFTAGNKIESALVGTFKYLKPTDEATNAASRETRVKEVMHKFMCSFFDDSIDLTHQKGAGGANKVVNDVDLANNTDTGGDSPEAKAVIAAIGTATGDSQLDVMSGSASGNNTEGEVMGVYDTKNNEVLFFGFSNCGSDD